MKHPYIWGAALTAALFIAGMAANARLEKWANEEPDPADGVWCFRCGRSCLMGGYRTEEGDYYCHKCGEELPGDWWEEE